MTGQRPVKFLCEVADMLAPLACEPPPQHWLSSDATYSYCYSCARLARWLEMDVIGPVPPPSNSWDRDETEERILEGIEGGNFYSGESDTPQSCETCGCTLRFSLTSYGVEYTLEGFEASTIDPSNLENPDCVYELREMLDHGAWHKDDALVAEIVATATVVRQMLASRLPSRDQP